MLVPMDPLLMQQVLFNLMENAARHGETVKQIDIFLYQKEDKAILEVADDGVASPTAAWSISLTERSTRRRAARMPPGYGHRPFRLPHHRGGPRRQHHRK